MEKETSKQVPIDPLIAQQYFADAASKARGIIDWPSHEVMARPEHEIVPVDPDKEAAKKAQAVHEDYNKMRSFYDDEVSAMRDVRESRNTSEYAESIGKEPSSFIGIQTPGNVKNLIGEGHDSVFTNQEIEHLDKLSEQKISEGDELDREFTSKLPNNPEVKKFNKADYPNGLFGDKAPQKPYDQDEQTAA